ncbi:MAG: hypothetical protein M3R50_03460 [Bacteroidota bacterium]|nr:hypothetical protein [Bacteroidota bacterium]
MRNGIIIILSMIICNTARSQEKGGMEQYYYTGAGSSTVVPKIYYESTSNWHSEIRYNYEELQTISFNMGKRISLDKRLGLTVTPIGGVVLGKLNGGNIGSNIDLKYKKIFVSLETQFTFSVEKKSQNFFFNWSEAGYQFSDLIYAGVALQVTHPFEMKNNWQPGIMIGFCYRNWTFPLYAFDPLDNNRNYVIGINWEWHREKVGSRNL